jgi:MYXO-CTERM domain-containing protein
MIRNGAAAWLATTLVGISGAPASADSVPTLADIARSADHRPTLTGSFVMNPNGPTNGLVTLVRLNTIPAGRYTTAVARNYPGAITGDAITVSPAEFELVEGPRFDDTATFAFTFTNSTAVHDGTVPAGVLVRFRGGPTSDELPVTATDPTPLLSPVSTPPAAVLGLIGVLGLLGWRMWTRRRNSVAPA